MGSIGGGQRGQEGCRQVFCCGAGEQIGALDLGNRGKRGSTGSLPEFLASLACGLPECACLFGGLE